MPLRAADGALLGILSIDEPLSRRRPGDAQLEVLGAVAAHAAVAIEHAQSAAESLRHRMAVEHLLRVSSQLSTRFGAQAMFDAVCVAIRDALGFGKVMLFLPDAPGAASSRRSPPAAGRPTPWRACPRRPSRSSRRSWTAPTSARAASCWRPPRR